MQRVTAKEVLKKYAAGERNFQRRNLRGANFKGANLPEANFSECDLRGANFRRANLTGVCFRGTKAGLRKRWAITVVVAAVVLAGILAFVAAIFTTIPFDSDYDWPTRITVGVVFLATYPTFTIVSVRRGVSAAFGALAAAVAAAAAAAAAVLMSLLGAYLGWRALNGNPRDPWLRDFALAIPATFGTRFVRANLTAADFSCALLKNANFHQAFLRRTNFRNARKLHLARPGNSYLRNPKILNLLVTGTSPEDKAFDRLDLRGINLADIDLTDASFIATDLSEADLSNTDLSRARLVQTQLDLANLTNATLTAATIEEWNISADTRLDGIKCDYIFMRLPPEKRPAFLKPPTDDNLQDPNPHRKPDDWQREFAPGEFTDFIAPLQETLDLYHNQVGDPRAIALALQKLRDDNPNAELEVVSIERRGQHKQDLLVRAATSPAADPSELHQQYFQTYDTLKGLPSTELQACLLEAERAHSQQLVDILKSFSPTINNTNVQQQESNTMSEDQNVNVTGNVGSIGNQGTQHNVAGEVRGDQTFNAADAGASAAVLAEIRQIIATLSQNRTITSDSDRLILAGEAIKTIEGNPTLQQKAIAAAKGGALVALKENPVGKIVAGAIEGWTKA